MSYMRREVINRYSGNAELFKWLLKTMIMIAVFSFTACYPPTKTEIRRAENALIQIKYFYPKFQDDEDFNSLEKALRRNLEYLKRLDQGHMFSYGPHQFTCQKVIESQEAFLNLILKRPDIKELNREIKLKFRVYRAAGRVGSRRVLFTGYFEPIFDASLKPDKRFKYPIYGMPDDLIRIDLSLFNRKFEGHSIVGRMVGKKLIPYHSRMDIEGKKVLRGKGLEIAWLKDPLDVAFLHIQGSGRLRLPDGNMISVGYLASNGRPYHSIGRYMLDKGYVDREDMSMQGIRSFLTKHPEMIDEVLNHNPSYVFFRVRRNGPYGSIEAPLTAGRSIALSSSLFPKGALCFISSQKPVISGSGEIEDWTRFSRFIMNQDTGGAIQGAGRADIFWGSGRYAELAAGHMKHEGKLYVLIKKP